MMCRTFLALQPICCRARLGQRCVSGSIHITLQQHFAPVAVAALNYKAGPTPPRTFASAGGGGTERIYTDFHIYKTRAALAVRLLPPLFAFEGGYRSLQRDGVLLLEFANANPGGQQPAGGPPAAGGTNRTYNWGAKVTFAMSPVELGNMLAGDALATEKGLVMFHDPAKLGKSGEPMKRLTLKQMPDGAISFSLSAGPDNISVPVSRGEFEVLKSLAHFAIPRLLGFDAVFQS